MANFKAGDRVRIVGIPRNARMLMNLSATGREATVIVVGPHDSISEEMDYGVSIDGWPCDGPWGDWWGVRAGDLAPLTGPSEMIEDEALEPELTA